MSSHRPFVRSLLLCLLVSAVACGQQWIITEIHTGTPDFVEIRNVSGIALPVSQVGLMTANNAACPAFVLGAGAAQQNGAYVSSATTVVPDGGYYVFEDLGTAGSPALTTLPSGGGFPPGTAGERMGLNLSWAGGSHGEVALFSGASVVGGVAVGTAQDYVAFQAVPALGAVPFGEGYRFNPPGVFGVYKSGPVARTSGFDVLFRVQGGGPGGFADSDTDADWNAASGGHTGGADNPVGTAGVATFGVDLAVENLGVALTLTVVTDQPSLAGFECFNLVSLLPTFCAGSGPLAGLEGDVFTLLFQPLGTDPFHVVLDGAGNYTFLLPIGVVLGLSVEARTIVVAGPSTLLLSNFAYATI